MITTKRRSAGDLTDRDSLPPIPVRSWCEVCGRLRRYHVTGGAALDLFGEKESDAAVASSGSNDGQGGGGGANLTNFRYQRNRNSGGGEHVPRPSQMIRGSL